MNLDVDLKHISYTPEKPEAILERLKGVRRKLGTHARGVSTLRVYKSEQLPELSFFTIMEELTPEVLNALGLTQVMEEDYQ